MKKIIEQTLVESVTQNDIDKNQESHDRYEKPVLVCYGDVRDITLGPSPGFGESGAGVFFLLP